MAASRGVAIRVINATVTIPREVLAPGDLVISDDAIKWLELLFAVPVHGLTSVTGMVTNLLNMIILYKLGLKNSMWVGAFALSLTDLLVTSLQLAVCLSYLLKYVYPESTVDMWMLGVFALGWMRYAGYYISCWITTMISLERCFCVVSPFRVKCVFTRGRCVVVVVLIYAVYISLVLPIYVIQHIDWKNTSSVSTNNTSIYRRVLTVEYTEESSRAELVIDTVGAVALSITSQAILIACTIGMTLALKDSSRIRQNAETLKFTHVKNHTKQDAPSALSSREVKLIHVVICLAVVLTACNLPRYAEIAAYHLIPGMSVGAYRNLLGLMWDVSDFFGTINCSSNFLVYWMLNEKFRKCFWDLFVSS